MNDGSSNVLRVEGAAVGYGRDQSVIEQADMYLDHGAVHLLIGRNGAGKSTLLRAMAGLHPLQKGRVVVNDHSIHALTDRERAAWVAYVASTPPRTSQLRVGEVLELAAKDRSEVTAMLSAFGEEHWWDRRLDTLSDGEAQRVMFARALLQNTPWVFMDEPTAFLDVPSKRTFWKHLAVAAERGQSLILATHDYEHLASRGAVDSVHLIHRGALQAVDAHAAPGEWTEMMES